MTDGCQTHAGILNPGEGTLTDIAKAKFIQAVKDELVYGTDLLPTPPLFPCGISIPPTPYADLLDLENEEKFPDFHKNTLGSYESIAQSLDIQGNFTLLPICCPVSLGFKLGVNIDLDFPGGFLPFFSPALPLLALKMNLMPPFQMALKFPNLPSIPPPLPNFPLPTFDPTLLLDLYAFNLAFIVGIPKFLADLVLQIPTLALKIPNLPDLFSAVCDLAFKANLFGDIDPRSLVEIAATKVLTAKVVEMVFIAAVASTLGSAPNGVTGGVGTFLGYKPPPAPPADPTGDVRTKIVDFAKSCDGLSFSSDKDTYAQQLFYYEYNEGSDADKQTAYNASSVNSSCGLFVRAAFFNGGAAESFFSGRYVTTTAISGLLDMAKQKGANITYSNTSFPSLKKGDAILIANSSDTSDAHVLLVASDYDGGLGGPIDGIEGGQTDSGNGNKSTAIASNTYDILSVVGGRISAGKSGGSAPKAIIAILDGEKMVAPLPTTTS